MIQPVRSAQAGVARGMGIALGLTGAAVIVALTHGEPAMLEDRLRTLGIAATVLGAWAAAAIGDVARRRFASPAAIDGGDADPAVDIANAILRNTIEQAVLALLAYAALALVMPAARLPIALSVAMFSAGRLLFWSGYRDGAASRALGFGLTFYPSVAALLVAAASLLGG